MNGVEIGIEVQLVLAAAAVLAAVLAPPELRARLAGALVAALGVAGVVTGLLAQSVSGSVEITTVLPVGPLVLSPTPLGGLFMVVAGGVGALAAVFAIGYVHGPSASATSWLCFAVFLLAMQLVPAAVDVLGFLLMWELMAVASTALVLTEYRHRADVRSAAVWYAVMTQLSFLLILAGLAVLAAGAGSWTFAAMAAVPPDSGVASLAFLLLTLGFATKAGLVPLHVWLPRAHPAAPSHVSATMSAAMVKMGVYGVLLVGIELLPGGPSWWGLVLIALGAVSAVYGILHASVTSDLKRLLAYSTTENTGLMFLAAGTGVMLRAIGADAAAQAAVTACLLLVISHAAFKTTLFLGAGSVLHATGERDLDRLGGLGRSLPWTAAAFGIAALGAAALPVTSGFVAEWALLQSLIHGAQPGEQLAAVVMPVCVAVVALTAGLALMTFAKAYGIAFLARPRSAPAQLAVESPWTMRVALLAGAALVVGIGLVPGVAAQASAVATGGDAVVVMRAGGLDLSGIGAVLDPVALTVLTAVLAVPVLVVGWALARRRPRRQVELAWGCGGARVSPRMQYTATSYAEPLSRVFDDALRPRRDVEVTHLSESSYLVERVQFEQRVEDVIEVRAYRPLAGLADRFGDAARWLQNGRLSRYLAYSFVALLVVLVVVTL